MSKEDSQTTDSCSEWARQKMMADVAHASLPRPSCCCESSMEYRHHGSAGLPVSDGCDGIPVIDAVAFLTRSQPRRPSQRRGLRTLVSAVVVLQLALLLAALRVQHACADDIFIHQSRAHDEISTTIEHKYRHYGHAYVHNDDRAEDAADNNNDGVDPTQRIIGGSPTSSARYPYMVSLQRMFLSGEGFNYFAHVCGGTLIAPDLVLTAAHCFDCSSAKCYDRVALGRHDFRSFAENTYVSGVENGGTSTSYDGRLVFDVGEVLEIKHPGYRYNIYTNDIGNDFALIKLPDRANSITASGGPLHYVKVNRDPEVPAKNGTPLTVAGWGALETPTAQSNNLSPMLMDATVSYVNNGRCTQSGGFVEGTYYSYWNFVKPNMMCALTPGQDACVGKKVIPVFCMR